MLYSIYTTDYNFFLNQKKQILEKNNLVSEYTITDEESLKQALLDLGQGSFFGQSPPILVICKRLLEEVDPLFILSCISVFRQQGHSVCLLENTKNKVYDTYVAEHNGENIIVPPTEIVSQKFTQNVFDFTDAFLARNKKDAWIVYTTLLEEGTELVSIQGALFWALKTLHLVLSTDNLESVGVKPYVYTKMKKVLLKWQSIEIQKYISDLLCVTTDEQFDEDGLRMKIEQLIFSL